MLTQDEKLVKRKGSNLPTGTVTTFVICVHSLLLSPCLQPPGAVAFHRNSASTCTKIQDLVLSSLGPSPSQPWTGCAWDGLAFHHGTFSSHQGIILPLPFGTWAWHSRLPHLHPPGRMSASQHPISPSSQQAAPHPHETL